MRARTLPRVDVGMVTWNGAELALRAARSLFESDQGCDIGLLVYDNGSTDGTPELLRAALPRAEVIAGGENLGFSRAMNVLIAKSGAPFFFALNSDAWPEAGAVGRLVDAAERHPRAAAIAPLLLRPDGSVEHSTHPFPSLRIAALDALGLRGALPKALARAWCLEGTWAHDEAREVDWAVGAALLMRRAALDEVGYLEERFFMYAEDLEWCWRAHRRGWEVRFEPSAVVRHVGNASGARRFGAERMNLETANLHSFYRAEHSGAASVAYRVLSAAGCLLGERRARRNLEDEEAAHWHRQAKAHLTTARAARAVRTERTERTAGAAAAPSETRARDVAVSHAWEAALREYGAELLPGAERPAGEDRHGGAPPLVTVAVSTRGRSAMALRLLESLERQTIGCGSFEVVVVDDCSPDRTSEEIVRFATSTSLRLKVIRSLARRGPAAGRNLAWRAGSGPLVAFTDDDCVPDPRWLAEGVRAMSRGDLVVVGRTEPRPEQAALASLPFSRTVRVDGVRFFETCNVFYRRADLEAAGGFDERFSRPSGEDTELALSVLESGVQAAFCADALVHHEVWPPGLGPVLHQTWRWIDLPLLVRRHPASGRELLGRPHFWKESHPYALGALAGTVLAMSGHERVGVAAVIPWIYFRLVRDPPCPGPRRRVVALPGALVLDLCEVGVMAVGSMKHRTLVL